MNAYAIVNPNQGYVANIIVADNIDQARSVIDSVIEVTELTGPARIGGWWDGSVFMDEPPTTPEESVL
jgi:hypothetical protein